MTKRFESVSRFRSAESLACACVGAAMHQLEALKFAILIYVLLDNRRTTATLPFRLNLLQSLPLL
jgi:hypothetical protein